MRRSPKWGSMVSTGNIFIIPNDDKNVHEICIPQAGPSVIIEPFEIYDENVRNPYKMNRQ